MSIKLVRIGVNDAEKLWTMQVQAFQKLLVKYQDLETNPANETKEKIKTKLLQKQTFFYYIYEGNDIVGAIRVIDKKDGSRKRVAPVFIMEKFRNKGLAQKAFCEIERIHGKDNWELDTIFQEKFELLLSVKGDWLVKNEEEK